MLISVLLPEYLVPTCFVYVTGNDHSTMFTAEHSALSRAVWSKMMWFLYHQTLKKKGQYLQKVQHNRVGSKVAKITNFLLVIFFADDFSMATSLSGTCVRATSLQLCPTLCDPMDCSPPGSSVHGILQERMIEWVAMPSSRGSSQPRDGTRVSCTTGGFFTAEPPGKPEERNTLS